MNQFWAYSVSVCVCAVLIFCFKWWLWAFSSDSCSSSTCWTFFFYTSWLKASVRQFPELPSRSFKTCGCCHFPRRYQHAPSSCLFLLLYMHNFTILSSAAGDPTAPPPTTTFLNRVEQEHWEVESNWQEKQEFSSKLNDFKEEQDLACVKSRQKKITQCNVNVFERRTVPVDLNQMRASKDCE